MKWEGADYLSKGRVSASLPGEGARKEKKAVTYGGDTHTFEHACFRVFLV